MAGRSAKLARLPHGSYRFGQGAEFTGPRTAIVTGGAKRIGAAIARALSADGWHLLIHCNRSTAEAEALAGELGNSVIVAADLADAAAADAIFQAATRLPPARLLVNNALAIRI
jgi:NAD(P)-dependent dehydrogenase (short-subunit alcohol dehydrogenase family)